MLPTENTSAPDRWKLGFQVAQIATKVRKKCKLIFNLICFSLLECQTPLWTLRDLTLKPGVLFLAFKWFLQKMLPQCDRCTVLHLCKHVLNISSEDNLRFQPSESLIKDYLLNLQQFSTKFLFLLGSTWVNRETQRGNVVLKDFRRYLLDLMNLNRFSLNGRIIHHKQQQPERSDTVKINVLYTVSHEAPDDMKC